MAKTVNKLYIGIDNTATPVNLSMGGGMEALRALYEDLSFGGCDDVIIPVMLDWYYNGNIDIADYWSVGDIRQASDSKPLFQVNAHTRTSPSTDIVKQSTIKWVIIGLKHDDLVSNINGYSKAAITIQTLGTIGTSASASRTMRMNSSDTNYGGWTSTEMRQYLDNNGSGVFYNACGFEPLIKRVQKKYCANNNSSSPNLSTSNDYIFLLSEYEVFGSRGYSPGIEGSKYAYFTTTSGSSEKMKKTGWVGNGEVIAWWLRSSHVSTRSFCNVSKSGYIVSSYTASSVSGVAPACCL